MWAVVFFLIFFIIQFNLGTALNFLKEPSSKFSVKGNQITFDCQIDASQPSYRWIKDESNITKGRVSVSGSVSTLLVDNLEFSDAGNYTCIAVDLQSGQQGERTGLLTVEGKPTIVQAPTALVSYVGQSVIFHCVVVGNPKPNVCWKNSSEIITTRGRIEVFSNGSLKINNLLKSDDGSFFICEAKNSYGISTASATLHVNDPPTLPSFTVKPVNQTAQEGQRVTFYCTALGNPSPTITWSKLAGSIPADRRQEPSPGSLRIINLQADDDGIYICTAQNFMGNVTAQVFLRIQGYPRITTEPSNRVVTENSSVQFRCVIEGDPTPYVRWTTPSGVTLTLLSQPSGSSSVLANNSLSITMVTVGDAGRYTCSAVNSIGRWSASAVLTVLAPPRFSSPLNNRTQNVKSQLGVECEANAVPVPHYQWLFNGSVIARQKSLNLSSVSPFDQGFYTCIANNSLGSAQGRFYLTIQEGVGDSSRFEHHHHGSSESFPLRTAI